MCEAPPLSPRMPPAGVDWARGSLCASDSHGRASASSENTVADDQLRSASGNRAAPRGSTASARMTTKAGDGTAAMAFDGIRGDGTVWRASEGMPQWLQFEFLDLGQAGFRLPADASKRVQIAGYGITPRSGVDSLEEDAHHALYGLYDSPMDWQLLGSMDGVEWFEMHRVRGATGWTENQEKRFEVSK